MASKVVDLKYHPGQLLSILLLSWAAVVYYCSFDIFMNCCCPEQLFQTCCCYDQQIPDLCWPHVAVYLTEPVFINFKERRNRFLGSINVYNYGLRCCPGLKIIWFVSVSISGFSLFWTVVPLKHCKPNHFRPIYLSMPWTAEVLNGLATCCCIDLLLFFYQALSSTDCRPHCCHLEQLPSWTAIVL